jgi:hypothetical protein
VCHRPLGFGGLTRCNCQNFKQLVRASYRPDELGTRLAELERDELRFYDIYCDQQWYPTPDEKTRLAAELKRGWDLYCATPAA